MLYQSLGKLGSYVSRFALGTATFGGAKHPLYGAIGGLEQALVNELVGIALDAGVTLFDSADIYAGGESEQCLGKALGSRREQVLIATKVGNRFAQNPNGVGLGRIHLMNAIEGSLRRLGTDRIDLLQLHTWDPRTPLEETLRTLDDAVRAGKVRHIGCSNFFAWQLMKANATARTLGGEPLVSLQAYYSLATRDIEREIIPAVQDQGMALFSWCPLAAGLLTGKFTRDKRPSEGARRLIFDFPPVDAEHGYRVVDALVEVAARRGVTAAQMALAWLYHQPAVTAAIVGVRSVAQLRENLQSIEVTLASEDLQQLDAASRLSVEYPRWYQDLPLGRLPGEGSGIGRRKAD